MAPKINNPPRVQRALPKVFVINPPDTADLGALYHPVYIRSARL